MVGLFLMKTIIALIFVDNIRWRKIYLADNYQKHWFYDLDEKFGGTIAQKLPLPLVVKSLKWAFDI